MRRTAQLAVSLCIAATSGACVIDAEHVRTTLHRVCTDDVPIAFAHARLTPAVFDWMRSLAHAQPLDDEVFLCHGTPRSDVEGFLDSVAGDHTRPATTLYNLG